LDHTRYVVVVHYELPNNAKQDFPLGEDLNHTLEEI
jgi:hypothetical protein